MKIMVAYLLGQNNVKVKFTCNIKDYKDKPCKNAFRNMYAALKSDFT